MEKYKLVKTLGDGAFGSVHQGLHLDSGQTVAIKKMKQKYYSWNECLNLREVKSLKKLDHPNIVKLREVLRDSDELYFVFEFMEGNLYQWMKSTKESSGRADERIVKRFASQILRGLSHMHRHGFFHRDMKPENLLLTGDVVKIADLGLAREIRSLPPYTEYVSTRWYRSPELLLRSKNYNSPIDIWAAGVIIAEMFLLDPLFPGTSEIDELFKICALLGTPNGSNQQDGTPGGGAWEDGERLASAIGFKFPSFPKQQLSSRIPAPKQAIAMIGNMLYYDPNKRITATNALKSEWFDDIRDTFDAQSMANLLQGSDLNTPKTSTLPSSSKTKNYPNNASLTSIDGGSTHHLPVLDRNDSITRMSSEGITITSLSNSPSFQLPRLPSPTVPASTLTQPYRSGWESPDRASPTSPTGHNRTKKEDPETGKENNFPQLSYIEHSTAISRVSPPGVSPYDAHSPSYGGGGKWGRSPVQPFFTKASPISPKGSVTTSFFPPALESTSHHPPPLSPGAMGGGKSVLHVIDGASLLKTVSPLSPSKKSPTSHPILHLKRDNSSSSPFYESGGLSTILHPPPAGGGGAALNRQTNLGRMKSGSKLSVMGSGTLHGSNQSLMINSGGTSDGLYHDAVTGGGSSMRRGSKGVIPPLDGGSSGFSVRGYGTSRRSMDPSSISPAPKLSPSLVTVKQQDSLSVLLPPSFPSAKSSMMKSPLSLSTMSSPTFGSKSHLAPEPSSPGQKGHFGSAGLSPSMGGVMSPGYAAPNKVSRKRSGQRLGLPASGGAAMDTNVGKWM